jgi:prephenate dehydratase
MKIALSGIAGSFSEEAARKYLGDAKFTADLLYATTAEDTFKAVESGEAEYGVVPIENHNGGLVRETIYAMAKHIFDIKTVFEIDVHQNLIVKPGTKREDVTEIVSHPQGLAQCRFYLRRDWHKLEQKEYADTALAAKDLAEGKLPATAAVIASKAAADLYGLEVLEPSIQDLKFNFTAFLVFTK